MTCRTCGEVLEGDGYFSVLHCPNAVEQPGHDFDVAPDSDPIYCHPEVPTNATKGNNHA